MLYLQCYNNCNCNGQKNTSGTKKNKKNELKNENILQ